MLVSANERGAWRLRQAAAFTSHIEQQSKYQIKQRNQRKKAIEYLRRRSTEEMALQWMILTYIVAAEAALAFILTIPSPKVLKNRLVSLVSLILQPALFIVPFAAFQLLDIYWKNEHRLMCTSEICTAAERDRSEKSIHKAERNVILCASACILYWCLFRICKFYKDIQSLEEAEKRYKDQ